MSVVSENMRKYNRENRQESAKQRQKLRSKRSNKDQIQVLDSRLGKNVGAKKERSRLTA